VLAAAVLATFSFHIYYSQEVRTYVLLALATTLYAAAAFFFVKFPTYPRAVLVAVCGLALVYSYTFGTLNWIAIAIGISANILLTFQFSTWRALTVGDCERDDSGRIFTMGTHIIAANSRVQ